MIPKTTDKDLPDIYFDPEYGRIHALLENGEADWFEYECEYGKVYHMFILRRIPEELGGRDEFDIITPYGYGGPLLLGVKAGNREKVIEGFCKAFEEYCRDKRIISEFIRFHPMFQNHNGLENFYDISFCRETVLIDMTVDDILLKQFSRSRRRWVRHAMRPEMECHLDFGLEKIDEFIKCYKETMDKNNASSFYYFPDEYFYRIKDSFKENVMIGYATYFGTIVTMKLLFIKKPYMHFHLGGTFPEYYPLNLYTRLTYETLLWGQEKGYRSMHLGGGLTNSRDDNLLRFKQSFTQSPLLQFYVGKKIYDQKRYDELCKAREARDQNGSMSFFPFYRS